MSTLQDLQRMNVEKMAAREAGSPASKEAADTNDVLMSKHQDIMTDSNIDNNTTINTSRQTDSKMGGNIDSKPARKKAGRTPVNLPNVSTPDLDPVDRALLQKLGRPYPDLTRDASTLVSSRLPNDVVTRLGVAADLVKKHKKTKQDVITRGLILAFEELVTADGDVEWYDK